MTFSSGALDILGSGAFCLTQYNCYLKKCFKKGIHLEWSDFPEETLKLLKFYLKNDSLREKISLQGQKEVFEKHTVYHRFLSMFDHVREFFRA